MNNSPAYAYLIDSSIYIFRGWFSLPDSLRDRDDHPVNAVYGFADFLLHLLLGHQPRHLACAFDASLTHSVRNSIFPDYKANRAPAPEELKYQFKLCRQLVTAAGIKSFSSHRYEADDLLASLARHLKQQGFNNVVVTADKDLTQLIRSGDYWWNFAKDTRMNPRDIERKFGVRPEQIADLLALTGDSVDNIPGIPGIGITTAARLLKKWHTLEQLFANLSEVGSMKFRGAKRIQQLLAEHQQQVQLARQLTGLYDEVLSPTDMGHVQLETPDFPALEQLFTQLRFSDARIAQWHQALKNVAPVSA